MYLSPFLLAVLLLSACGQGAPDATDIAVHVGGVGLDPLTDSPVVVLQEDGGERLLPIWIGVAEARSIASEIEKMDSPRPNTHDLAKQLLIGLDATVARVVVTELRDGTYYAVLVIKDGGRRLEVDARPSDAIAIALRLQAPVFVREPLFETVGEESATGDGPGLAL